MEPRPLHSIRGFLLDLDGTVYLDGEIIPGADLFCQTVREQGKQILFLTNNGAHSPEHCLNALHRVGIAAERDELFTCTEAAIIGLRRHGCRSIYPLATAQVQGMLAAAGFELTEHQPDYVLVAFDTDFTFHRLSTACRLISSGARLAATNPDLVHPTPEGPVPHTGAILAAVTAATGKSPDFVFGKPDRTMLDLAIERLKLPESEIAVVGDQLITDIALAVGTELTSILVMTGSTQAAEAGRSPYPIHYQFASIADMIPLLTRHSTKEA